MDMTVEVPELPELTFDEASHIYRLNGDIIPSVSKLMEPLKDQCYGGISKRTLENAAIKGSAVHNSIENWIKFGIDDIPSEHRGYFNGFVEWWKQYKPRVFGSEVRIYHKLMRYGGTIDLLCEIGGLRVGFKLNAAGHFPRHHAAEKAHPASEKGREVVVPRVPGQRPRQMPRSRGAEMSVRL